MKHKRPSRVDGDRTQLARNQRFVTLALARRNINAAAAMLAEEAAPRLGRLNLHNEAHRCLTTADGLRAMANANGARIQRAITRGYP